MSEAIKINGVLTGEASRAELADDRCGYFDHGVITMGAPDDNLTNEISEVSEFVCIDRSSWDRRDKEIAAWRAAFAQFRKDYPHQKPPALMAASKLQEPS